MKPQQLTEKKLINKQKNRAFGKDIYLLGEDEDGIKYWLEAPSWDCSWYWGFGYVKTYTNNKAPHLSKDINSHEHIDSSFMGQSEHYDYEKKCFCKGYYIHNIYDCPRFAATTFDEKTGWTLSELFKSFYNFKDIAEVYHRGGSHVTDNPCKDLIKNQQEADRINKIIIPAITSKILELLTP